MSSIHETNEWDNYLKYGERQFYKKKSIIYREKEDGVNGFYFLKKGMIKMATSIYKDREIIIDIVSSNLPFGEQATDGDMYFSTAIALEDSVVYFFTVEKIESLMEEDNRFRMLVFTNLTEKLKTLANNVVFSSLPSEQLLARSILSLQDKFMNESIPFTQQELCRCTSLNRGTVYKVLKEWDKSIICMQSRNITITNTQALKKIATI